jgi:hypothetical protein
VIIVCHAAIVHVQPFGGNANTAAGSASPRSRTRYWSPHHLHPVRERLNGAAT